jgi:hypothetical protein
LADFRKRKIERTELARFALHEDAREKLLESPVKGVMYRAPNTLLPLTPVGSPPQQRSPISLAEPVSGSPKFGSPQMASKFQDSSHPLTDSPGSTMSRSPTPFEGALSPIRDNALYRDAESPLVPSSLATARVSLSQSAEPFEVRGSPMRGRKCGCRPYELYENASTYTNH